MINPNMPNMQNIPGMEAMTDTLDFVKNLWGSMGLPGMNMSSMNLPGMVMPTLSVEEIRKRITDMKAVESWLTLNMNMLRGTIQALEVQAATISTLQSMGESFSATMGAGMASPPPSAAPNGAHSSHAGSSSSSGNGSQASGGGNAGHDENDAPSDEKLQGAPQPSSKDESDAASLTAPLVNAAAWWNMLQDQFKQAVTGAMSTENPMNPLAAAAAAATAAAEKPKAKPKAKAAPATKSASASASTSAAAARKRKPAK